MDYLVAVEIRSWFLKELKADIPVLRILKGSTPNSLLDLIWESLLVDLVGSRAPTEQPKVVLSSQEEESQAAPMQGPTPQLPPQKATEEYFTTTPSDQTDARSSSITSTTPEKDINSGSMSSVSEALSQIVNNTERTVQMSFGQSCF